MTKIEVLGSGCPTCKKLYDMTKEIVTELNPDLEVEYITDVQKIIEMGVMQTPVLVIDGRLVIAGFVPDREKVMELIKKNLVV